MGAQTFKIVCYSFLNQIQQINNWGWLLESMHKKISNSIFKNLVVIGRRRRKMAKKKQGAKKNLVKMSWQQLRPNLSIDVFGW